MNMFGQLAGGLAFLGNVAIAVFISGGLLMCLYAFGWLMSSIKGYVPDPYFPRHFRRWWLCALFGHQWCLLRRRGPDDLWCCGQCAKCGDARVDQRPEHFAAVIHESVEV